MQAERIGEASGGVMMSAAKGSGDCRGPNECSLEGAVTVEGLMNVAWRESR